MEALVKTESKVTPIVQAQPSAMLEMIQRFLTDPAVSADKLEKLMDLQDRVEAKNAEQQFNVALGIAQSEIENVRTNKANSQTRSRYADFAALDAVARPVYTQHGFSLSFNTAVAQQENHIKIICLVSHSSGHTRPYEMEIPADGKGAKGNDVMTKTHAAGSGVSYGRRYLLQMIFNIVISDDVEDDDGNKAGEKPLIKPPPAKMSEQHLAALNKLSSEANVLPLTICKSYKGTHLAELPDSLYEEIVTRLNNTISNRQKRAEAKRKKEEQANG